MRQEAFFAHMETAMCQAPSGNASLPHCLVDEGALDARAVRGKEAAQLPIAQRMADVAQGIQTNV